MIVISQIILQLIFVNILFQNFDKSNYSEKIPNSDLSIEMIFIQGGEYSMGNKNSNVNTQISSFWMSKYEITWEIYNLFMEFDQSNKLEYIIDGDTIKVDGISKPTTPYTDMTFGMGYEGFPAVNMTHFAASKFCKWLSLITGNYYRLPTEAEWEYACRSGTSSDYYYGDDISLIDEYSWNKNNSDNSYQRVGQKIPNKWGLHDMLGNVSEWVADSYDDNIFKSKKLKKDPFIFSESKYPKVYRGGSWNDEPSSLLTYKRFYSDNSLQKRDPQIPKSQWWNTDAPNIGFRIVRVNKDDSESRRNMFWNN
jgi:formylglycine-generating enzyme required for sulfatase activity|tara:strand:+ start:68 stop:994 length:927 start_codon:yes stop_codon:yes gene_type:complete